MTILLYELVGQDSSRPFSPHCWKAAMALAHKGLDFRSVPTTFTKVPAVEGGVSKTVPVIRDGDKVVADSFAIALYLDDAYPDRPTLFGGPGGEAMARFIERWSQLTIHPYLGAAALMDIHAGLAPLDQAYFRESREKRYGKTLEDVSAGREAGLAAFRASLEPLRNMLTYQPFIGGDIAALCRLYRLRRVPVGAHHVALPGAGRRRSGAAWFGRCLDLHGGIGRGVTAAA